MNLFSVKMVALMVTVAMVTIEIGLVQTTPSFYLKQNQKESQNDSTANVNRSNSNKNFLNLDHNFLINNNFLDISHNLINSNKDPKQKDEFNDLNQITQIISKINNIQSSWKAALYSDPRFQTKQQFRKLLGAIPDRERFLTFPLVRHQIAATKDFADIPVNFDARKQWSNCSIISDIRNQGKCGSCWAVSTAGAISDRLCISSQGKVNLAISAIDLACCENCYTEDGYCNGGRHFDSWQYFKSNGLVTGGEKDSEIGCKPYQLDQQNANSDGMVKCEQSCSNAQYPKTYQDDLYQGSGKVYSIVPDVEQIQTEIMTRGSVTASMEIFEDFRFYQSGVYSRTDDSPSVGWHAVRMIGWGVDEDHDNDDDDNDDDDDDEGGTPYWLVANSWGSNWGDGGLFKIRRGINVCSIETMVCAGKIN